MSEPVWVPLGGSPAAIIGVGTSLPGSPTDGQEYILVDSLTAPTYAWRFRYMAAKVSNKWLFIGGAPAYSEVLTYEATSSTSYVALTTAGPSIVIPVAGDYIIEHGFNAAGTKPHYMAYDIGATPANDADMCRTAIDGIIDGSGTVTRLRRKSIGVGSVVAKYRGYGGQSTSFGNRWMAITPVAVGG